MKYSLRSLIVVVTLTCFVLGGVMGRVEYLRRWAVFHEEQGDNTLETEDMRHHRRVARLYREAMRRPWITVKENTELPKWLLDEIKREPAP